MTADLCAMATLPRAVQSLPQFGFSSGRTMSSGHLPDAYQRDNRSENVFTSISQIVDKATGGSVIDLNNPQSSIKMLANGRTASSSSISQSATPVFCIGGKAASPRRQKLGSVGHQDSFSSEQSSDIGVGLAHSASSMSYINVPHPHSMSHHSRASLYGRHPMFPHLRHTSISSSDDDIHSTPDCLTESDFDIEVESGSFSERTDADSYRGSCGDSWQPVSGNLVPSQGSTALGAIVGSGVVDPLTYGTSSVRNSPCHGSSLRQRALCFQRGRSVDYPSSSAVPQTRDSGAETASSTQTLNEDGSKVVFLSLSMSSSFFSFIIPVPYGLAKKQ